MKLRLLTLGLFALVTVSACTPASESPSSQNTNSAATPPETAGIEQATRSSGANQPTANNPTSDDKGTASSAKPTAAPPQPATAVPAIAPQSTWTQRYSTDFGYYNKTSGAINVRTGPSEDAPVKASLDVHSGGYIQNCATDLDWCEIDYGYNQGWVYMPLLEGLPDPELVKAANETNGQNATCVVKGAGGVVRFEGACNFSQSGGNGSFSIESPTGPIDGNSTISVSIIQPGVADVRGVTTDGVNSRWGEAKRSSSDPACWVGSDFEVCAY